MSAFKSDTSKASDTTKEGSSRTSQADTGATKVNPAEMYRQAGVDVDAGNAAARRYAGIAKQTRRPEVLGGIGGFAGGFALDLKRYPEPVLVSGTDGVGTKLKVAFAAGRHDTVGIDCVAMCVNDILAMGAEPLYFLDYLAVGKLDVDQAADIVAGIARGCELAGCALIGGETAEMPGMYTDGEYDVAGFAVGVVNRDKVIDGTAIKPGDVVLGLASDGIHSNGYSLVRKLITEQGLGWTDSVPGWRGTVAQELLTPTRIYVRSVLGLIEEGIPVKGMAHITGGGLIDNIPRCLPEGVDVALDVGSWPSLPVFDSLMEYSGMEYEEAARVWNLGIGYILVVPSDAAEPAMLKLSELGEAVYKIGEIVAQDDSDGRGDDEGGAQTGQGDSAASGSMTREGKVILRGARQ